MTVALTFCDALNHPAGSFDPTGWFRDAPATLAPLNQSIDSVAWVHLAPWSGHACHGLPTPTHLGGVFVQPATTVLGLRGWPDAMEWLVAANAVSTHDSATTAVCASPFCGFDLEKIIRMMLRQSPLALEILAASAVPSPRCHAIVEPRTLIQHTITQQIRHGYLDIALAFKRLLQQDQPCTRLDVLSRARSVLTGAALVDVGAMSLNMDSLRGFWPGAPIHVIFEMHEQCVTEDDVDAMITPSQRGALSVAIDALLNTLEHASSPLPERPSSYGGAQQILIDARLKAMELV